MSGGSGASSSQHAEDSASSRFSAYDLARFAIFLGGLVRDEPLRGTAAYQHDTDLGDILRISLDGDIPGRPEIIVAENEWRGLITPDYQYGCDYCLILVKPWSDEPRDNDRATSRNGGDEGQAGPRPGADEDRGGTRRRWR